jgi:hypothetical protein
MIRGDETADVRREQKRGKGANSVNFAEEIMSSSGSALFIFSRRDFLDLPFHNITSH